MSEIPTMMHALVKERPGRGLALRRVPVPEPRPDEVLLRVEAASICGTDLHIYEWDPWAASRIHPPRIIGHEICGRVVAAGRDVHHVALGTYASAEGHLFCGRCYSCGIGRFDVCTRVQIVGVDVDGGLADYVTVPARNLWPLDPSVPPAVGAIMDPLGNAVHTALAGDLVGATVVVSGCGPIGLCSTAVAKRAGAARVLCLDLHPGRLAMSTQMGADESLTADEAIVERVLELTRGEGADAVLEMSGSAAGIRNGLDMLRPAGWMSLLGLPPGRVELDLTNGLIFKGATLYGINGRRIFETWYKATALLQSGLDVTPIITHQLPLDAYEEAFELMESGEGGKVVLRPAG